MTYPEHRTLHAGSGAESDGHGLVLRIPLGQAPSLHPLRRRQAAQSRSDRLSLVRIRRFRLRARVGIAMGANRAVAPFVRGLPWYYGPVRLPVSVHRRRTPEGFPTRPAASEAMGGHGISRFPRTVFPRMHGVSDRAGSQSVSRWRRRGCGLPPSPTASAPRSVFSRLNTQPARTPVYASPRPYGSSRQDSGPSWLARPSTYDSFIHYTLPV